MYPLVDGRSGGNLPHPRFDQTCYRNMLRRTLPLLAASAALCAQGQTSSPVTLQLQQMANGLTRITDISHCGDERLFLTLQPGTIRILDGNGALLPSPFLDITGPVNNNGNEQGLLGLAFDPNYATNGYFYVHYTGGTGNGSSVISRFSVSTANPNVADPASEDTLFIWPQPYSNHNGGDLDFGPDGYLYVGFGDGGSAGDPLGNAQDLTDPLGDIIRIDVSDPTVDYTIPPTNPHVGEGNGAMPEIWASGLRNPYRWGFDRLTGDLWIGDVGQNAVEEVDFWPAGDNSGPNFGWRCYEGNTAYNTAGCTAQNTYVAPAEVHQQSAQGWCSVIGGRVYRGDLYWRLEGKYVYTDYCGGQFYTLVPNGSGGWIRTQVLNSGVLGLAVIAENSAGELYAASNNNGVLYKIKELCTDTVPTVTANGADLSSTEATSYQWYLDGAAISGATSQNYTATETGNYAVLATFAGGCQLASEAVEVTIMGLNGNQADRLVVRPQPATDELRVEGLSADAATVLLTDASGRTAFSGNARSSAITIGVSGLSNGLYTLQVLDAKGKTLVRRSVAVQH